MTPDTQKARQEFEDFLRLNFVPMNAGTDIAKRDIGGLYGDQVNHLWISWQSAYALGRNAGLEEAAREADHYTVKEYGPHGEVWVVSDVATELAEAIRSLVAQKEAEK